MYGKYISYINISKVPSTTKPEKFENVAVFLRLGLPAKPIRHENGATKTLFKLENLKTRTLHFRIDGKYFENGRLQ